MELDNITWDDSLSSLSLALTLINCSIILLSLIVTIFRDSHPVIISSTQSFLIFLLFGFFIFSFLPLLLIGDITTRRCNFIFWFMSVANAFILGPLLLKAFVVYKLVDRVGEVTYEKFLRFEFEKHWTVLLGCGLVFAIQQVIILLWISRDPIGVKTIEDLQHKGKSFEYCDIFESPWFYIDISYIVCLFISLGFILIKTPKENVHLFNEITHIKYTILFMIMITIISTIIILFVSKYRNTLFIIQSVSIFLFVFCSLGGIFGPKVYLIMTWDEKKWEERSENPKNGEDEDEGFQGVNNTNGNLESTNHNGFPNQENSLADTSTERSERPTRGTSGDSIEYVQNQRVNNRESDKGVDPFNRNETNIELTTMDANYRSQLEMEKLDLF